jgi:hypothetical protein
MGRWSVWWGDGVGRLRILCHHRGLSPLLVLCLTVSQLWGRLMTGARADRWSDGVGIGGRLRNWWPFTPVVMQGSGETGRGFNLHATAVLS